LILLFLEILVELVIHLILIRLRATKVSILVDSKGNPLSIHCVSANVSDICLVLPSIYKIKDNNLKNKIKNLIGDKGYVSKKSRII